MFFLNIFCFADPLQSEIEQCAKILGVPINDLEIFVRSYYVKMDFSNPNAENAIIISSLQELEFLKQTNGLKVGSYYKIRGKFISQNGKKVQINDNDFNGTAGTYWVYFDIDYMLKYPKYTVLNVLLTVTQSPYAGIQYVCVEIVNEK
jgi:hypothetical protein